MNTTSLKIGSLFSGYGGLDIATQNTFGGQLAWWSDIEPGPKKIMSHHHPHAPNLEDITRVDWHDVEPVDIIAGGSPCQDLSTAGKRQGMKTGTRSGLWASMADAIDTIKPRLVVWENVLGALSSEAVSSMEQCEFCMGDSAPSLRALGRVLGDLTEIGYYTGWQTLRASTIGAPHHRERVFVLAIRNDVPAHAVRVRQYGGGNGRIESRPARLPGQTIVPAIRTIPRRLEPFGPYARAVHTWETVLGREAPPVATTGPKGGWRMNPAFVEWMMGLPEGHITQVPALTWQEAIRALGNGVIPQQAEHALRAITQMLQSELK